MTGRGKYLAGCGILAGLLLGGTVGHGVEFEQQFMVQQGRFACGVGFGPAFGFGQPIQQAPTDQTQDGFVVAASGVAIQDTPAGEALKLIEEGQWVKAIQAIESLSDTDAGLVVDERGVLRPLSAMKSALIASMPEQGRRTFNKLNDPSANAKLAQAEATTDLQEQARAFKAIVDDYALCDASAQAALRIGDIRFEQGRFSEAAAYYGFAAEHPATTADDPALMARRLTALSRAEQWKTFDQLAEYARFRHADTTITLAGQDTPLQTVITQLVESRGDIPIDRPTDDTRELHLPKATEFAYERPLIDEDKIKWLRQLATNNNLAGIIDQTIAPTIASDGQRLFTLAVGRVEKINPETGTALWQFGNTDEAIQAIQSRMHNMASGYHQSLSLHGDTLLATIPHKQNVSQAYLYALNAETGEEKWNLRDILRRSNESVVGTPIVVDEMVYLVTYKSSQELLLRAIQLDSGTEVSQLVLGKASKHAHINSPAELSPRLTMGQSHLLVQTNNGAMIAVQPHSMKIAWAYSQKIRPSGVAMMRRHGFAVDNALSRHTGDIVAVDGMVVGKDTRTNRVVAFREYDAAMLWETQTDSDATIVHHDDQHIYVLGKELVALNRRTGERVWWTPHHGERSGKPVFTRDACLIAGSQRFCRIDLATGNLTHYREDMTSAAALHVVGEQLIGITDQHLVAIPLP